MPKLAPQQCVMVDQDVLALQRSWRGVKLKGEFYVNGLLEINDVYYTPFANVVSFCSVQCLCITGTDCLFQANGKQLGFYRYTQLSVCNPKRFLKVTVFVNIKIHS